MVDKVSLPVSGPVTVAPAPADAKPGVNITVQAMPGARPGLPAAADVPGAGKGPQKITIDREPPAPESVPAPASDRPTWLPEKFKSPEDLAQAYRALEQRLGGQPAPVATPEVAPVAAPEVGQPAAAPQASDLVQKLTQEWAGSGKVSPESRAEFTRRTGLPDTFIDQQISYLQAQNQRVFEQAEKRLGGAGAVAELTEWAKNRLSPEERAAFNRATYSGDAAMSALALDGLAAKYEMEVGRAPKVMAGRKPQPDAGGIVPFQSHADWQAARRDPKYREDPAYRAQVEDRLRVSMKLGLV